MIPSVFAAYKKGDWTISGFFAITGGGGKASFDDGLPMFESAAMAGIFQESLGKYIKTGGKVPSLRRICILLTVRWTENSIFILCNLACHIRSRIGFLPLPEVG